MQIAIKRCSLSATNPRPKLLRYLSVRLLTPSILFSFSSSTISFSFYLFSSSADAIAMFSVSTNLPCIRSTAYLDLYYMSNPVSTTFFNGADSKSINSAYRSTRYYLPRSSWSKFVSNIGFLSFLVVSGDLLLLDLRRDYFFSSSEGDLRWLWEGDAFSPWITCVIAVCASLIFSFIDLPLFLSSFFWKSLIYLATFCALSNS